MRATIQSLEEIHPGRGREAFNRIAILSGAGSVGSAGMGEQPGGIDLTGYETNEAISAENRAEIARILGGGSLDDEDDEPAAEDSADDEAETLVKRYNKDELAEFARVAGLDGNAHTNKLEMAKALIAAGFVIPKEGE